MADDTATEDQVRAQAQTPQFSGFTLSAEASEKQRKKREQEEIGRASCRERVSHQV